MHRDADVEDSESIQIKSRIDFLNVNWQRNVDRTHKAELIIAEVQRPDSRWYAHNEKPETAECNIQLDTSALTAGMWKHGCSCIQREDHWASDIKFSTKLGKSKVNYKLYHNFDCQLWLPSVRIQLCVVAHHLHFNTWCKKLLHHVLKWKHHKVA